MATLRDVLTSDQRVREGDPALWEKLDRNRVRCYACGHCCPIPEGQPGVCKVRFNHGGTLYVPWGYVAGVQCDPIEKKPFFHAHPGALAYSFGMLGCDLHCSYCYNEPLITSEWAVAVFRQARKAGLLTAFVSNGNGTPQVLEYLHPWIDLYKVDLKSFDDRHYHELGGRLQPILDTIRSLHKMGVWLEIVTLLIPGFNDGDEELRNLTSFLSDVSPDIPWHVTAFHQDYKMVSPADTRPQDLLRAAAIGRDAGLRYIYAGNLPGRVEDLEDTHCHRCGEIVIQRFGYSIEKYKLTPEGDCPACHSPVPGRWSKKFDGQIAAAPFLPRKQSRLVKILSLP